MEEAGTVIGGALLKSHMTTAPPDMSPFFLRQYVKGHASDVFEAYPQLLTEMALRLPYQVQKQADNTTAVPLTFQQVICFLWIVVFWDMTSYDFVGGYQYSGECIASTFMVDYIFKLIDRTFTFLLLYRFNTFMLGTIIS
jgi:hypothetical protein